MITESLSKKKERSTLRSTENHSTGENHREPPTPQERTTENHSTGENHREPLHRREPQRTTLMIKLARQAETQQRRSAPRPRQRSLPPVGPSPTSTVEFPRCAIPLLGDDARTEPAPRLSFVWVGAHMILCAGAHTPGASL
jgi:hypothetical protein